MFASLVTLVVEAVLDVLGFQERARVLEKAHAEQHTTPLEVA